MYRRFRLLLKFLIPTIKSNLNKKTIIFLVTILSNLAGNYSFSQPHKKEIKPDQYRAINWTINDGLSGDNVHTMIKDAKGFLWVGSDFGGFCRFDGATFKEYLPDPNDRNTINSDKITSFTEDSLNNLWIGTNKGLSRYDIKADTFTNFPPLNDSVGTIALINSSGIIVPIGSTMDSIFCIEPGAWITGIDIHTLKRRPIVQVSKEVGMNVLWNTNKSFFDAKSNSIWKLSGYGQQLTMIEQIFLDNGKAHQYSWPCYRNNVNHPRHDAEDMVYDSKRNSIWINSGEGLLEFSLNDKQFHKIEAFNEMINTKGFDHGVGIDMDINGRIWFSTFYNGIFIYDPKTNVGRPVFSEPDLQKKAGNANLHIYCDRDGIVWTSNFGSYGIYEILPHNPPFERFTANPKKKDSLSTHAIYKIIPVANGEMWIGTKDGLNIFDTKTDKFQVLRQKDLPGISGNFIVPVYVDTIRQKAWLRSATPADNEPEMALYEMDLKTRLCKPLVFREGTKLLDSFSVASEWFLPYKNGLIFCDERHGIFEIKENSLFADLVVSFKSLYSGMVLAEDRFIFLRGFGSAPNLTFENKNGKWIKTHHLVDSLEGGIFYNRKDQTYWVSFKFELVHYTKDFRKIKTYRQADGYNGAGNILLDDADNLWFTNKLNQICRLNTTTGIITTISHTEGYQKQDFGGHTHVAKDEDGNLYFGSSNSGRTVGGLDRIYPERYSSTITSSVYLLSLTINQKPFPLSIGVNNLEKLSLQYNQNTISIETGIIDFYAKGTGHIRYKLKEGNNEVEWQYSNNAYYTIRYEKLPPGRYELVLQASNTVNEFNSPQKKLTITISSPFWQTWWFRLIAAVFVIAIVYGIIQYRSSSLKKRNILLENMVTERTSELRATQDQLIHSEKMASLGELTSGIAHEIKNPLNFINNFSELNLELITEIDKQPEKEDENAQIIKTLKKNLEKINHHGKRVDDIVKSMLQHSRSGNMTKEPVNINALCEESLKLAYHGYKAREKTFHASFETHFDPGLPQIMAIPQELSRVLLNLFNNAFYAVHEKKKNMRPVSTDTSEIESAYKPMLTVSTKKSDNKMVITISDNGTGIPQKIISKIFQPFFTTKPAGEGTGLGLSMSYDIITKSHGGELHVKSREGEGTDLEIQLPAIKSGTKK